MSKKQNLTEELFRIHEMMGLTESQIDINEDGISYDPSKIDQFVVEARKDVQTGAVLIERFGSTLINASLISVFENMDRMEAAQEKMSQSEKYLAGKFNKFFDIVEMYEFGEYPDNVNELNDLANQLDNQSLRLSELSDAFDDLIYMTKKISEHNEEFFKTKTID